MRDEYARRVANMKDLIKELEEKCADAVALLEKRVATDRNGDSNNPGMFSWIT